MTCSEICNVRRSSIGTVYARFSEGKSVKSRLNQNAFYEANYARFSVKSRFSVAKWGDQQSLTCQKNKKKIDIFSQKDAFPF